MDNAAARHRGVEGETWPCRHGPITPWTVSASHPDPARRMTFYVGVGHPHHLTSSPIPLFISATTLARYRRRGEQFPVRARTPWAGDSGAYSALMLGSSRSDHPWWRDPDDYGGMWVRLIEDLGTPPAFVACQDLPCEPSVRRVTGLTVRDHQELTTDSYLYLSEQFPMVPWLPVLQGWQPWEYLEHAALYQRRGIDLTGMGVGIGSVCRRGSQRGVAAVVRALAPLGMLLHGFGVSINALRLIGHRLHSADSQAWSATARREQLRLPGCNHTTRPDPVTRHTRPTDCRNCLAYAARWREEALSAVRAAAVDAAVDAATSRLFDVTPDPILPTPVTRAGTAAGRRAGQAAAQLTLFRAPSS
jgi:hypothetical protein